MQHAPRSSAVEPRHLGHAADGLYGKLRRETTNDGESSRKRADVRVPWRAFGGFHLRRFSILRFSLEAQRGIGYFVRCVVAWSPYLPTTRTTKVLGSTSRCVEPWPCLAVTRRTLCVFVSRVIVRAPDCVGTSSTTRNVSGESS